MVPRSVLRQRYSNTRGAMVQSQNAGPIVPPMRCTCRAERVTTGRRVLFAGTHGMADVLSSDINAMPKKRAKVGACCNIGNAIANFVLLARKRAWANEGFSLAGWS